MNTGSTAWAPIMAAAACERAALSAALADPEAQQLWLLRGLLATNTHSVFGREHDFARLTTLEDYRAAVPIRSDREFAPWLARVVAGDAEVLTAAAPLAFETTSGTSGEKLIPYPAAALAAFRAGVLPWLGYLLARCPRIASGVAYVAASPVTRARRALDDGMPIGLGSDAAYLGADLAPALSQVITVPPPVEDLASWRAGTLAHLARRPDLTLISVWSPTFLLELLEGQEHRAREWWPNLQAVSLWMDGSSAPYAARVAELLPGVHLDAKGVLATESVITVRQETGCVPALTSAFLEFLDADGAAHLAHELLAGTRYRTVISTPGGLYRYDLGDVLECESTAAPGPILRFIGRAGVVSDLVGEKLCDSFVAQALAGLPAGAALVPRAEPRPRYELWLDCAGPADAAIAAHVDALLGDNPQYAYARRLGQLSPLDIVCSPGFARHRARTLASRGVRLGDAKSCALILDRSQLPTGAA